MVIFRELSVGEVIEAAAATVRFTAQILVIVACAGVFALASHRQPGARNASLLDQISGGNALAVPAGGQRSVVDRRLLP